MRPRGLAPRLSAARWLVGALTMVIAMTMSALVTATASAQPVASPDVLTASAHVTPAAAKSTSRAEIYWGAVIGPQFTGVEAPYDMRAVKDFVKQDAGGKGASIVPLYQAFDDCSASPCVPYAFPTAAFNHVRGYGAIPMVSWGSSSIQNGERDDVRDQNFTLSDVVNGKYDAYITAWAKRAKAYGHSFFLRFDWEMNGNWFVWGNSTNTNTAADYVAAWRHVHNIFTKVGADNATWVWCPNNGNAKGSIANLASFYPGNAYVDWTCTDVYNFGATGSGAWLSWNHLAMPTYQAISRIAPAKPMMIAEFNSDSVGGSQASWLSTALAEIPAYPRIRAAILFDTLPQWQLEGHPASQAAFAKGIARPVYAHNSFRNLTGRIQPL